MKREVLIGLIGGIIGSIITAFAVTSFDATTVEIGVFAGLLSIFLLQGINHHKFSQIEKRLDVIKKLLMP